MRRHLAVRSWEPVPRGRVVRLVAVAAVVALLGAVDTEVTAAEPSSMSSVQVGSTTLDTAAVAEGAFTVTNGNDSGTGSYRQAIATAAADGTDDVITFSAGLSVNLASDVAYTGTTALTLNGNGSTIDGNGHQILAAVSASSVTVNRLTLTDGYAVEGGAIATADGDITITNSTLTGNTAENTSGGSASGGAVSAGNGAVAITNSTLTGNTADGDTFGSGGAVSSYSQTVTITDSTLSNNAATGHVSRGGAVAASSALVSVTNSILNANSTTGAITNVVLPGGGGAVDLASSGSVTVTNSTLNDNRAVGGSGGAISAEYGVNIQRSTLDGNEVLDYWGRGGGAHTERGVISVTNSTLTRNTATDSTTDHNSAGGAVAEDFGSVVLRHVTLASNSANINAHVTGTLQTFASVYTDPLGGGTSCYAPNVTSNGHNYSTDDSCGLDATGDTENGADPQLMALGDYGGPTHTRPPSASSPLVDAIPTAACNPTVPTDQRGRPRPFPAAGRCDIGAVEVDDITQPTVDLRSPAEGAVYARNRVVVADFSCGDEAGGSGIASCAGTVPDGSPVNTATLGPKSFTVTATDRAGNTKTVTHSYTVADARPDARIRRTASGALTGDGIYSTLTGQTLTGSAARGRSVAYFVSVQSDAPFAERLLLRGQPSNSRFSVRYTSPTGVNITNRVTAGTYTTPTLAPQGTHQIKVTVTVLNAAPRGAALARTLRAASVTQPTITDTVKFVTRRS